MLNPCCYHTVVSTSYNKIYVCPSLAAISPQKINIGARYAGRTFKIIVRYAMPKGNQNRSTGSELSNGIPVSLTDGLKFNLTKIGQDVPYLRGPALISVYNKPQQQPFVQE
jgi:hypothetical protein